MASSFDEQAMSLEYLSLTISSLLAEISGDGLLPTPPYGGTPPDSESRMGLPRLSPSLVEEAEQPVTPPPVQVGGVMMCLASVLEALSECDEACVFSVRKINKLGFKSHAVLKKYFGQFGTVSSIFFLPYRYKPDTASVRPSSMAFIRMSHRDSVSAIFAQGTVHYIHGWPVTVQSFSRSSAAAF